MSVRKPPASYLVVMSDRVPHDHMTFWHGSALRRLVSEQDKTYFKRLLYSLLRQRFDIREEYDKLFSPHAPVLFGRAPILQRRQRSALLFY